MFLSKNLQKLVCLVMAQLLFAGVHAQIVLPDSNLVSNGDFMACDIYQRPLDWTMGTGLQTATLSHKERHGQNSDDYSLKIADTSVNNDVSVSSPKLIASPGIFYDAKVWVKQATGVPAHFSLEFWGQSNQLLSKKQVTEESDTDWKQLLIRMSAPDSCTHVTVSIRSGNRDTGVSYWDDVTLNRESTYDARLAQKRRELFIDDYRIARMQDVQHLVHPGLKSKILITATRPWEGDGTYIYGTVLHNQPVGSGDRMWYSCYSNHNYYLCYAISKDGIHWKKPSLGIVSYKGSKKNNICRTGGGTLVFDPGAQPSGRYKLMSFDKNNFGYNVYFSKDGLHWVHYPKPVISYGDVSNVAYDTAKHLFIATTKERMVISNTGATPGKNDRCAFVSVSEDFIHWHAPGASASPYTLAVEGTHADNLAVRSRGGIEADVYGMPVYPYQGVYIGFPWFFDIKDYNTGIYAAAGDGKIQPQIAVSRDLRQWSRPDHDPVIPLGKAGAWDDGTLYTSSNMEVTDSLMIVYFGAMNLPHGGNAGGLIQKANIARATWRRDGFVSLYNVGYDTGKVLTKPIMFMGSILKVNAQLNKGGKLLVEILDKNEKPIPGYTLSEAKPISGDQYAFTVQWKKEANLSKLQGRKIELRFYLTDGNLYSYWFE